MQSIIKNSSSKTIRIVLIVLGAILLIVGCYSLSQGLKAPVLIKKETSTNSPKAIKIKSISSNILLLGNTFWGRYIDDWSMVSPLKYQYPFSRLNEFNRDQYDAWISGLECPTVASVHMTSAEMEQALQFNCSPSYLPEAAKWFTVFSLANNHTDNQGIEGFQETKQQLEKNGIQYFGHYDPRVVEDICEVISLPVTILRDNKSISKGSIPTAMCGYHGVFRIPSEDAIQSMQQYSLYMPVIAMPHMGVEYQAAPDGLKTSIYRSLIDYGADMVIGDHPHWIQTTESYKGHLIVYSMGNFMFDQQDTAEVTRSAGIRVLLKSNNQTKDLDKWLEIGEYCSKFKDECLSKIEEKNLSKLEVDYQFGVIGTSDSNKITKPANSAEQFDILKRLNWQSTVEQLRSPYGSL